MAWYCRGIFSLSMTSQRFALGVQTSLAKMAALLAALEHDGCHRVAVAQGEDVVVVLIRPRGAQHDEVAAATAGAHAHVVLVDVVAPALQHPEASCRRDHIGRIASHVGLVPGRAWRSASRADRCTTGEQHEQAKEQQAVVIRQGVRHLRCAVPVLCGGGVGRR